MKNYKIAGGKIISREDDSTVESLNGRLTSVTATESESGKKYLNIVLKDGEEESSLRVLLYGDVALKILRCLYGAASFLSDGNITISLEDREGARSLVHVALDSRDLPAVGSVPSWMDLRQAFTQRLLYTVAMATESRFTVAVLAISDTAFDDPSIEDVADIVYNAVGNNRTVRFTKKVYTSPAAANAFIEGAKAAGNCFATSDGEVIEMIANIIAANNPETEPAQDVVPEDNEEV